jgi:D-alanyl-D-alanine carboxypeptidase/D-alanyl-D-alanine carboxypeptidase (penicillin-binding protein 5/6)
MIAMAAAVVLALALPRQAQAGYASMVIDYDTGKVLNAVNPDAENHPASLTKMMTLYLTFEALYRGKIGLYQQVPVSAWAAGKSPTKLGLRPGQTISVHDCILGMVTKSANDAATVMAEALGGSEEQFVTMMNEKARALGMTRTFFRNASGLPDSAQVTTARDLIRLSVALYRNYPEQFRYFATREFMFRGQIVRGHNHLMERYAGMDGIKTGFTDASGFNLASTASRQGRRLFGVVMGGSTHQARDRLMETLLDDGFANRPTSPLLVAQAAGVRASLAREQLAGLDTAPPARLRVADAAGTRHHRNRSTITIASARGPSWSIRLGNCSRRVQAVRETHAAVRLAHLSGTPSTIVASGRRHTRHVFHAQFVGLSRHQALTACETLNRKGHNCLVIPPPKGSVRVASE